MVSLDIETAKGESSSSPAVASLDASSSSEPKSLVPPPSSVPSDESATGVSTPASPPGNPFPVGWSLFELNSSIKKTPKSLPRKKSSLALSRSKAKPLRSVSFVEPRKLASTLSRSLHRVPSLRMTSSSGPPAMATFSPGSAHSVSAAMDIPASAVGNADNNTSAEESAANEPLTSTSFDSKRNLTYKDRRKTYRMEKKKLADELISAMQDPTILVMSDWLKVRTALKQWNKYYCELRPGSLYLYKSQKTYKPSNWIGTVMLKMCELIERPSKKNGFCFKLFHPLEHPIWAPKGPHGEAFVSLMFGLPATSIIFRAPSMEAGTKWMQAIELTFKYCNISKSAQSQRDSVPTTPLSGNSNASGSSMNHSSIAHFAMLNSLNTTTSLDRDDDDGVVVLPIQTAAKLDETEIEKHFDLDDETIHTDHGELDDSQEHHTTESDDSEDDDDHDEVGFGTASSPHKHTLKLSLPAKSIEAVNKQITQTCYVFDGGNEEFGLVGDAGQTEDVPEENKSLLWTLLKQVRPGMDLSKVVLPTFILEPRSFLEKLTDYYYHSDILSKAVLEEDPLVRMKLILKWYLSGFYKKPKGLKKPYNPILGETFRCYWRHPETGSKTYYLAEQVSHHPPISAFYVTNRKDGFCISGSILTKSKFYGNSISAMLEGTARLTLLSRGEEYCITFPYAHCKGIFLGPLAFELGGKVNISCDKTGYKSELEFKLKPFFSFEDQCNLITGKVKLGSETMATIEGHWDADIYYRDKRRKDELELFWSGIDPKVKASRLKRYVVPLAQQADNESQKLWSKVTLAIEQQDQQAATVEKTLLEEAQRESSKLRTARMQTWQPKLFTLQAHIADWQYNMADTTPWDVRTDVEQYEHDYAVKTLTRHLNSKAKVLASHSIEVGDHKDTMLHAFSKSSKSMAVESAQQVTDSMASLAGVGDSDLGEGDIKQLLTDLKTQLASMNESIATIASTQAQLVKDVNFLGCKVCTGTTSGRSMQIECGGSAFSVTRHHLSGVSPYLPALMCMLVLCLLYNWLYGCPSSLSTPPSSLPSQSPSALGASRKEL